MQKTSCFSWNHENLRKRENHDGEKNVLNTPSKRREAMEKNLKTENDWKSLPEDTHNQREPMKMLQQMMMKTMRGKVAVAI